MTRIAINGLGRIGRTFMRLALEHPALEVVNGERYLRPRQPGVLDWYDSVYGKYQRCVKVEHVSGETWLQVGTCRVRLVAERHPDALPWKALDVQIVIEATGAFETYADARRHVDAGRSALAGVSRGCNQCKVLRHPMTVGHGSQDHCS
jgi:glyceraldehyde 3-phosphate dehydrogenase